VLPDAKIERITETYGWTDGPVWVSAGGYLLFSDISANLIYKWAPGAARATVFLERSGFTGPDVTGVGPLQNNGHRDFYQIGSNGLTLDRQGMVVICAQADRQIVRLEQDGRRTVLAAQFEGKRLNSPNDVIFKSDGALYFTDPPAGLRGRDKDPKKELNFNGVFLLKDGKLDAIVRDLPLPNGIALSQDERFLYISDTVKKVLLRFDVQPDDSVANGKLFADMSSEKAPGAVDGMKVDQKGNVYSTGPGGVWIISPEGRHLGTIAFPEDASNLAFGDSDGKMLYVTARSSVYRLHLIVSGARPN
jgi:gluconolactonase